VLQPNGDNDEDDNDDDEEEGVDRIDNTWVVKNRWRKLTSNDY